MSVSPTKTKAPALPALKHGKGRRLPGRTSPSKATGGKGPHKGALSLPPIQLRRDGGRASSQLERYKAQLRSKARTKPLPIGAGMAKRLRHKKGGRPGGRKIISDDAALRADSGSDQRRAERAKQNKHMQKWLEGKKQEKRKERVWISDLEKAGVDEKKRQSASRYEIDMAFLDWNERKRKEAEDRRMASDDVLHCPKGLTLEEVLRACKFVTAEIEPQAQTLVKQLVKEMARTNEHSPGFIDPEDCELIWSHARMHYKLVAKVNTLETQGDSQAGTDGNRMRFQDEQNNHLVSFIMQSIKSSQSVFGSQLKKAQTGRTFLGTAVHSIKQFFDVIDKDKSGTIDQNEFAVLCGIIDQGLTETQISALWSSFDVNEDGEVTFLEFEDTLVTAEARQMQGPVPPPIEKIKFAIALHGLIGETAMYDLFVDIFMKAMRNRVNKVLLTDGMIGMWEFTQMMKELETPELTLLERRRFLDIYNRQVFRKFSSRHAEGIFAKVEDILYFSHKLIKHMTDLSNGRIAAKTKNALDFLVGKKILKNFANNNKLAAGREQNIIDLSAAVFKRNATQLAVGTNNQAVISRHTMQLVCQGLGFSLSAGEIDNVFSQIDGDGNGTIDLEEWTAFLENTQRIMSDDAQKAADAADPRNDQHLVHSIITQVSNRVEVLSPIVSRMQDLFTSLSRTTL